MPAPPSLLQDPLAAMENSTMGEQDMVFLLAGKLLLSMTISGSTQNKDIPFLLILPVWATY